MEIYRGVHFNTPPPPPKKKKKKKKAHRPIRREYVEMLCVQ